MKSWDAPVDPDYRRICLRPGDVLYVPRGFPHFARTTDCSSLHYTIGVEPYRWIDFMAEALQELATADVTYRHALPVGFLDGALDDTPPREFAEALVERLGDAAFADRVRRRLEARRFTGTKASPAGHFASLDGASGLEGSSLVTRAPGVHCRARQSEDSAVLDFVDNFVSGPSFLMPATRFIARHRSFQVDDLPGGLTSADKVDLVERLVNEGLLQTVTSPRPHPSRLKKEGRPPAP